MANLTTNQVNKIKEFCKKEYLRVELYEDGFTIKKASDNYLYATKEGNKFNVSGCVYETEVTLTKALNLAKRNL